jgi:outer membrane protein OmpA-like peptidoglycan-associated protein
VNDLIRRGVTLAAGLAVPSVIVMSWLGAAASRLEEKARKPEEQKVAIATVAEDSYCTPELKSIVRRVAGACGLLDQSGGRGCQPMQAKQVAQLSDADFNSLFRPLAKRAFIIQFDADSGELDEAGKAAIEKAWADQRGASFFFVVARASPDGNDKHNEELSAQRAKAVLAHLEDKFKDPDLKKEVGLLWLGEGFAQLGEEFCQWQRSRGGECTSKDINRSAFVAWIDCAI